MNTTRILTLAVTLAAFTGIATAADSPMLMSPRGAEAQVKTARGMADRQPLQFESKATALNDRKLSGTTTDRDRDLVKENRSQVYTGKNAPQRPAFEIAPVK